MWSLFHMIKQEDCGAKSWLEALDHSNCSDESSRKKIGSISVFKNPECL